MTNLKNALTIADANLAIASHGAKEGAAATSMVDRAHDLFTYAEVYVTEHGKEAARVAYLAYAAAFNANDKRGAKPIDLGNAKALKGAVNKFNTFIKLGAVERTQRHDFISRCESIWTHGEREKNLNGEWVTLRDAPAKKQGMYEMILSAARKQVEAGTLMTDAAIFDAMFPAKEAATRISSMEALATNCAKHIEKWLELPNGHMAAALASLNAALVEARKAEVDALRAAAEAEEEEVD